ncbi:glycosyltransferase family 39 protein, partial [Curtobacterium sp. B8]|uniref:ArnT family glycosyltransferase n=1 Tax=Curtobacterium sp. B8 TaxID=95611 RepID=UPI0003B30CE6
MTTEPEPPVVARWERVAIAVVTATFGLWLVAWALLVPVFEAPDETAHIDATVHVALGDAWAAPGDLRVTRAVLIAKQQQATQPSDEWATVTELLQTFPGPSTTVNQMTQHPPTAYLVGAAVLRAVHYGDLRWDHAFLALRLADVAMVTALPLLAWSAVRRVTRSPRAALVGGLAVFASPELASIGSSVSNDAPVLLLAGVTVWLATRMLTGDLRWRTAIGLAVALGALVWVKGTGLPAVPFVGVVVLFSGVGLLGWGARALRTVVVLGVSGAIGAWWWLHNLVAYGRVQPNGTPRCAA